MLFSKATLFFAGLGAALGAAVESRQAPVTFSISQKDHLNEARAAAIQKKRSLFTYGPDPAGSSIFFPSGPLGFQRTQQDIDELEVVYKTHAKAASADMMQAVGSVILKMGFWKVEDYDKLYAPDLWQRSVGKTLFDTGMQTNYTQDILFSMERLSINPFPIRRLNPKKDQIPFTVNDDTVTKITTVKLNDLFAQGRLFYVDYRDQLDKPLKKGRYAAGCDAYFYIDVKSGDFMPLAIRTNVADGDGLTYTPLDDSNDWMLAKMAFNSNDMWFSAFYHFASTHFKAEIAYEAGIRTLSNDHPLLAVVNRTMVQGFSLRQQAAVYLTAPGTGVDAIFPSSGPEAVAFSGKYYDNGAGDWLGNYMQTDFENRGLVNCTYGPALKAFPFWDDASAIESEHRKFITAVVDAYYPDDSAVVQDNEIQAWIAEAKPAKVINFPTTLTTKHDLVELVVHFAYLSSIMHQTMNTNGPIGGNGQLPFHPASLYQPLPRNKGVRDLMPYLPKIDKAIAQLVFWSDFARPEFIGTNNTLSNMWTGETVLSGMPPAVQSAGQNFQKAMVTHSEQMRARSFDDQGMCNGMPFIWKLLDPQNIPFYFAI